MRAASHAQPPPSRTPERRRSTSPKTSFRERFSNAETRSNAASINCTTSFQREREEWR
ncbi:MAG: hypothetical protein NXI28_25410 [bacterium]|nr:hypothetical protein [bacterium]